MRKGGGGECPPIVFLEGANIHHYAFVEGAIILPCQLLWGGGGQMSTHAIFHRGADVWGGEMSGLMCPTYGHNAVPPVIWVFAAKAVIFENGSVFTNKQRITWTPYDVYLAMLQGM